MCKAPVYGVPGLPHLTLALLGLVASTSTTTGESSMRCGPSFQLCLRDDGATHNDAGLPPGRMSISSRDPLLWVFFRLRSRLSSSEMYDTIGPRDGRQASSSREDTESANVLNLEKRRDNCHILTTDNRNVHLNARPNNNVGESARQIFRSRQFDEIYQANYGDNGDAISETGVSAKPNLNPGAGDATKKATYKPPIANIAVNMIF